MAPVDRFRIISKLGAGGCGEAFRAWDNQDGVPVVLKRPLAEHLRSPAMLERFDREIKRLSGLVHQHIVPIVDHGHDAKGLPYLAMRFLPAGSLADRQKPQAVSYLRFWLPSVAAALDYVHARGVVHRDVKPANIFFDTHFKAYLGDFGIAKVIDEELAEASEHSLTSTGGEIGTYPYMAPEFFRKPRVLSGAYDQYALAITVYEMICGQRPFTGDSGQLIFAHATQNPPDIRETVSDAPDSLCEAVHQALAKKPVDRFDSCAAFADAALRDVAAVPLNDALRYFLCPACMKLVRVPTDAGGKSCRCTRCNAALRISQNIDALWREEEAPSTFRSPQRQANRSDKESPARSPSGSGRITAHTSQDGAFRQLTQAEESRQANEQLTTSQTTAPKTAVRAAWKVSPAAWQTPEFRRSILRGRPDEFCKPPYFASKRTAWFAEQKNFHKRKAERLCMDYDWVVLALCAGAAALWFHLTGRALVSSRIGTACFAGVYLFVYQPWMLCEGRGGTITMRLNGRRAMRCSSGTISFLRALAWCALFWFEIAAVIGVTSPLLYVLMTLTPPDLGLQVFGLMWPFFFLLIMGVHIRNRISLVAYIQDGLPSLLLRDRACDCTVVSVKPKKFLHSR